MTVLITGATGFLGNAVLARLLENGVDDLRCLVRPGRQRSQLQFLQQRYGKGRLEIVEGNLTQRGDIGPAMVGIERVVHMAATLRGAPADMFLNTVVGSQHLLDAVHRSHANRIVVVSTLSVYDLANVAARSVVDERMPLESRPEQRDVYTHTKVCQEVLLQRSSLRESLSCVVLRPGPLYGEEAAVLPARLGLNLAGVLWQLGVDAPLPLTSVASCAEAVRIALGDDTEAGAYNVVDDDLPSTQEFIERYCNEVRRLRVVRLPLRLTMLLARLNEYSHRRSRGQVPELLTRYRVRNLWRGHRYANGRIKAAGWRQPVSTPVALDRAFKAWGR
jgi:nucleoside-diphosphate-sugar epimerase